jgi:predicted negative regulator of RcsB-dependent stress response
MGAPLPVGTVPVAQRDWGIWFKVHVLQVGYATGAVVILVAAVWLYFTSEARKESFAAQALTQARSEAEAGNLPLAASDLSRLMDRYTGTKAADEAAVLINEVRLVQGQTDAAVKDLQTVVQKSHPKYVLASAWSLLGGGLENQRKFKDAAQAYRRAAELAPHDFLTAQYLLDAGRVLVVSGDSTGARSAYGEVLQKYGDLPQAAEARVRMAEIGGAVPAPKPKAPQTPGQTSGG